MKARGSTARSPPSSSGSKGKGRAPEAQKGVTDLPDDAELRDLVRQLKRIAEAPDPWWLEELGVFASGGGRGRKWSSPSSGGGGLPASVGVSAAVRPATAGTVTRTATTRSPQHTNLNGALRVSTRGGRASFSSTAARPATSSAGGASDRQQATASHPTMQERRMLAGVFRDFRLASSASTRQRQEAARGTAAKVAEAGSDHPPPSRDVHHGHAARQTTTRRAIEEELTSAVHEAAETAIGVGNHQDMVRRGPLLAINVDGSRGGGKGNLGIPAPQTGGGHALSVSGSKQVAAVTTAAHASSFVDGWRGGQSEKTQSPSLSGNGNARVGKQMAPLPRVAMLASQAALRGKAEAALAPTAAAAAARPVSTVRSRVSTSNVHRPTSAPTTRGGGWTGSNSGNRKPATAGGSMSGRGRAASSKVKQKGDREAMDRRGGDIVGRNEGKSGEGDEELARLGSKLRRDAQREMRLNNQQAGVREEHVSQVGAGEEQASVKYTDVLESLAGASPAQVKLAREELEPMLCSFAAKALEEDAVEQLAFTVMSQTMVSAVCVHSANDQTGGCASAAPWVKTLLAAFSRDRGLIAASPSVPARIVASALVAEFASTGADKVTALRQIARDVGHEEGGAAFIERSGAPVVCASLRSKCKDQRLYASLILLRMASEGAQQGPFLASLACERSIAGLHAGIEGASDEARGNVSVVMQRLGSLYEARRIMLSEGTPACIERCLALMAREEEECGKGDSFVEKNLRSCLDALRRHSCMDV